MTKKEMIVKVLDEMGFKLHEDEDGDLMFRYQMKNIYTVIGDESEQYLVLVMPQFCELEDGEEHVALAVCNKMTRELKLAKVYVDQTFKNVSASCEFYYTDENSLKTNIENGLNVLGIVRTFYRTIRNEIVD
ncbi:MAG: YbjN domain-containing protein [Prevotella sp.]|nr:YbjN domain-containing protein [Prevotella sp.]